MVHAPFLPLALTTSFTDVDAAPIFNLNPYNLIAGLIFGTIGLGAWRYGKTLDRWHPRAIGAVLIAYPYFISNGILVWLIGVALLVLLWFRHYE